jgi:hypothetical protein
MRHYSCDVCGRAMHAEHDDHYVVKMQVYLAASCHTLAEEDIHAEGDDDDLPFDMPGESFDDMEELMEPTSIDTAPTFKELRYDLCPTCHKKFLADPLSREGIKFQFSKN